MYLPESSLYSARARGSMQAFVSPPPLSFFPLRAFSFCWRKRAKRFLLLCHFILEERSWRTDVSKNQEVEVMFEDCARGHRPRRRRSRTCGPDLRQFRQQKTVAVAPAPKRQQLLPPRHFHPSTSPLLARYILCVINHELF